MNNAYSPKGHGCYLLGGFLDPFGKPLFGTSSRVPRWVLLPVSGIQYVKIVLKVLLDEALGLHVLKG